MQMSAICIVYIQCVAYNHGSQRWRSLAACVVDLLTLGPWGCSWADGTYTTMHGAYGNWSGT